jgi:hypothetical protein
VSYGIVKTWIQEAVIPAQAGIQYRNLHYRLRGKDR